MDNESRRYLGALELAPDSMELHKTEQLRQGMYRSRVRLSGPDGVPDQIGLRWRSLAIV